MKLELLCKKDDFRPVLSYVSIDKTRMIASNGYVLAVVAINELFDEEFIKSLPDYPIFVHGLDFKRLRTCGAFELKDGYILAYPIKSDTPPILVEYKLEPVIGKALDTSKFDEFTGEAKPEIGITPKLLYTLSQAMGVDEVQLFFQKSHKFIKVMPADSSKNVYGFIMPVLIYK